MVHKKKPKNDDIKKHLPDPEGLVRFLMKKHKLDSRVITLCWQAT